MSDFAWSDYLEVAERLNTDAATEADRRSSISRAYYAAYHAAAAFGRARGILTSGHTHQRVWAALRNDPDPARAGVGIRGNALRLLRMEADYRNPFDGDLGVEVRSALVAAREIVDAIALLP